MSEIKNCPFCGEEINVSATKCKHCGEFVNTPPKVKDLYINLLFDEKHFDKRKKFLTNLAVFIIFLNFINFCINNFQLYNDESAVRQTVYSILLVSNVLWIVFSMLMFIFLEIQALRCKK